MKKKHKRLSKISAKKKNKSCGCSSTLASKGGCAVFEIKTTAEIAAMTRTELVQYLYEVLMQFSPERRKELINKFITEKAGKL